MKDIKVSISCITYNQVTYIEEAIKSFLMQKTDFDFEIIIHDDASTDGTAEIVKKYAEEYPDKIISILQKENQYSKGVKISATYIYPRAKGKYIALCEGDDFWTDENKLQRQYNYMEKHPDCNLCIHGAYEIKENSKLILNTSFLSDKVELYGMEDAIKGLGRKVATNSFFFRKAYGTKEPKFRKDAPCGDYVIPILCAEEGNIAYLPYVMSVHRAMAKNSISASWKKNVQNRKSYNIRYEKMLKGIDEYTNYQYTELLEAENIRAWTDYYIRSRDKKTLKNEPYRSYLKSLPKKEKIRNWLEVNCPIIIGILRKMKHCLLGIIRRKSVWM